MKLQCRKVLDCLRQNGSITAREALIELSIGSLSSRISELKALGFDITGIMERGCNQFGDSVYYKRYFLGGNKNEQGNSLRQGVR